MSIEEILDHAVKSSWQYHGSERFRNYFFPKISKYFDVFKGSSQVLDIGCCCGLFSLSIAQHADSCLGVDHDPKYLKNFDFVKSSSEANIDYVKSEIKDFAKNCKDLSFDSVFAANVLYHLDNETIELIEKEILPKCKKVLFFSRENKPKKKNKYDLYDWKKITEFLQKNGFKTKRLDNNSEIFTDYTTGYQKGNHLINRSVEKSHTDSVLIPVYGEK